MKMSDEFSRFPASWDVLPFTQAVRDATAGNVKIPKSEYLDDGCFPIVDQGQSLYGGFTDDEDSICQSNLPTIIFGDHTRAFKYIDTPFALGADGAKVLEPLIPMNKRFLFHYLNQLRLESAGYSRHFKFLKETYVPIPPLTEQKRIAAILDKADAIRRKRQQAIQLADEFLRAVFLDMFGTNSDRTAWAEVTFSDAARIDAPMVDPREDEYLDLLHIGPDRIEKNSGRLLPALTAREERLISKKFLFDQSYVLYSKIRPYLRKVALPNFTGLCSADMYPVRPKDNLLTREYLWQLLLSDEFTQYTETLPGRANIPKLNRNELANFTFKLPPISLQRKFSNVFEKQHQTYLKSKSAANLSESAFGSLSQKAFSGQL